MNRPRLDFAAIRGIPLAGVLARYNVSLKRRNGTALYGNCPLPSHSSKTKESFFVNTDRNVWYCHSDSCKQGSRPGGNVIDFVSVMEKLDAYDAAARLAEWFPVNSPALLPQPSPPPNALTDGDHTGNKPLGFELQNVNPDHPIIRERGITVETARAWGVGFFCSKQKTASMDNRIVFPLHENGALVGYAGRATLEGQEPKWLLGKGLKKTFLYGLDRCDSGKPLVLAESPWAVLWFSQQGTQAAALLGSEMTPEQESCLAPFELVIVALDNDTAGEAKSGPIIERLKANGHRVLKARLMES
jgi:DNA primase